VIGFTAVVNARLAAYTAPKPMLGLINASTVVLHGMFQPVGSLVAIAELLNPLTG
jgi:hypothetical protein